MNESCNTCKGYDGSCSGIVVIEQNGTMYAVQCNFYRDFLKQKNLEYKIIEAGIPEKWRNVLTETEYTEYNQDALQAALDFASSKDKKKYGLTLYGRVGTGKTHIACFALVNYMKLHDCRGLFLSVPEISTTIKQLSENSFFDNVVRVSDVILLDDIGMEKGNDWVLEYISTILNHVYTERKHFLITTNLPPTVLEDHIGTRLISRIFEASQIIFLRGKDRRRD